MAVVSPEKLDTFMAITQKWDIESAVIGEVNGSGRLTIDHHGQRIVDVDPRTVAHDGPVYNRPYARPTWQDTLNKNTTTEALLVRPRTGAEYKETALKIIGSPNHCAKTWVTNQFDRFVQGNTALSQPDSAGVIRVDESTNLGIAVATDASGRYTKLDPRTGAQLALAEAYRNVAVSGARPMAVTDCLNFGSPENPDSMWQLVEAIEGLADACLELSIPVTGGNVSLYNGTDEAGDPDAAIHPTPVVGVLGVIDDVRLATTSGWRGEGDAIFLLGTTRDELDGSAWADVIHNHLGGVPPIVDLAAERALGEVLVNGSRDSIISGAQDLSEGGLVQALFETSLRYGLGAKVSIAEMTARDQVTDFAALFSESTARALVSVPQGEEVQFVDSLVARGVPFLKIGEVGNEVDGEQVIEITGQFTVGVQEVKDISEGVLPGIFG